MAAGLFLSAMGFELRKLLCVYITKMRIELQIDECGAEQTQENWKSMISLCNIDEQPSLKFSKEAVVLD